VNILVTGAAGMVGTALVNNLRNICDGKDTSRPDINIEEIFSYTRTTDEKTFEKYCEQADFVFHLAGVNRPENESEFAKGNVELTEKLLNTLEKCGSKATVMLSSSVQASLIGRYGLSEYGRSKLNGEKLVFDYAERTGNSVAVYRFPNLMGHSRPNYNSAVSTFCWAVANDREYSVSDRSAQIELLYIDDLIQGLLDLLEGKEKHCEYEGLAPIENENGRYCVIPQTHKVTLGYIVDLLEKYKMQPVDLSVPQMPDGSFEKKLFSLYLSYLPKEKMKYELKMNKDDRGSFTELIHPQNCGQVSVNVIKPGITKGQHWHNSKWEQFIVVHGNGLIRERNINTGETVEFEVSGENVEAVYMIPGWTHSITNLSGTDELITVMICNEVFDPQRPDTYRETV